ncbi:MAG: sulfite exporter TauE/SafE family protein [Pseudolysinimonas sp.]|uniref:sulfite exporter TauE/SafE family protein n=1 Tax=Pseudolysinimonas sp. TaxID=2680009 RepID=UPI003C782FA7
MTSPTAPAPDRPTARHILLLVLVGVIGGVFSGALGVGGGIVMVPLLLVLLRFDQRRAAATSLAAIVLSSISGAATYTVAGHTDVIAGLLLGAGGVAGTLVGTRLLKVLPIAVLRWGFIALLVVIALRMLLIVPDRGGDIEFGVATAIGLVASGVVMGVLAGMFGIGGGVLIVPLLVAVFGASDLLAKGTSLLAMIPISIAGSIANVRNTLVRPLDGFVIGGTALLASLGGAALAFVMPPWLSSLLFGIFVAATAIQLTIRAVSQHRAARSGDAT